MKGYKSIFEGTLGVVVGIIFLIAIIAVIVFILNGILEVFRFLGYNFNYILLVFIAFVVFYVFTFDKQDEDKYELAPFILKYKSLLSIIGLIFMFVIFKYDTYFRIYTDGDYCAYVYVYNPKTGSESDYDLQVKVSGGAVTKIYWNNGGWLDDSHFDTEYSFLEDRWANFEDDRGREFSVHLKRRGEECGKLQ